MASKSVMMRVCDLHHRESTPSVKTVRFTWEGTRHQLDLCSEHVGEVESTVNAWVRATSPSTGSRRQPRKAAAARGRTAKRSTAKRASSSAASNPSRELRTWAKANGFNVSDRGRIPTDVRTAYEAATK